jgi:hypothetical protein
MGKTNLFFSTLSFSPWAILATWVVCRSSSENIGKMNLIPILNNTSPRTHTKLELGMLGVHRKLAKYAVHSSKRKN